MRRPSASRPLLAASRLAAAAAALLAGLGLFGAFHPAFDSLAHFRAHLAILAILFGAPSLLLCAPALGQRRIVPSHAAGAAAALAGLALLWPILPYLGPARPNAALAAGGRSYTLLQMNLRFDAPPEDALRRIEETHPDILTLQEVTERWRGILEARLSDAYPFQAYCRRGYAVGNTAILSRRPFAEPAVPCMPRNGFSAQPVDLDGRRVTVVAQHLQWPWPHGQWRQIWQLNAPLARLPRPVIVGGDFNAAPWSAAVRSYAESAGLEVATGIGPTWSVRSLPRWIGLPIDNVLRSPGIEILAVERLGPTASDHLPVLVTFSVTPPR